VSFANVDNSWSTNVWLRAAREDRSFVKLLGLDFQAHTCVTMWA